MNRSCLTYENEFQKSRSRIFRALKIEIEIKNFTCLGKFVNILEENKLIILVCGVETL